MSGSGPWLATARFDRGLLLPGRRPRSCADLRLMPDQVEVFHGSTSAVLDWERYGRPGPESSASAGSWRIEPWSSSKYGAPIGIALHTSGACRESVAPVTRSTRTPLNTLARVVKDRGCVAIWPAPVISRSVSGDCQLVEVLTAFLNRFPESRDRLGDRAAVGRLLEDMRARRLVPLGDVEGARRSLVEIHTAIRRSPFVHRFHGRPLPGDELGDVDEAVDLITATLRASPYTEGRAVDERQVRKILEREYFDVEPWPFAALM